jgi:hypothetical protein
MKHFIAYLFSALIVLSGSSTACQVGETAASEPQPAKLRVDHDILAKDFPVGLLLLDVLRGTGLRGGFVETASCSDLPKGSLQVKQGATVSQAMDALVAANPGYEWELRDDVVNLMPRGGAALLLTRIAEYQLETTDLQLPTALGALLFLPEVRERGATLGLEPGNGTGIGRGDVIARKPVPIHIVLQNLSLQEAFNKVVGLSRDGVWIYRESDCNGARTFTVHMVSDY